MILRPHAARNRNNNRNNIIENLERENEELKEKLSLISYPKEFLEFLVNNPASQNIKNELIKEENYRDILKLYQNYKINFSREGFTFIKSFRPPSEMICFGVVENNKILGSSLIAESFSQGRPKIWRINENEINSERLIVDIIKDKSKEFLENEDEEPNYNYLDTGIRRKINKFDEISSFLETIERNQNSLDRAKIQVGETQYDYYLGKFNEEGFRDGFGKYYGRNGKYFYSGFWDQTRRKGKFFLAFIDNEGVHAIISKTDEGYIGGDSNFYGEGVYFKPNGEKREGKFKGGKLNGEGTIYYQNGKKKYTGELKDGIYHGDGVIFSNILDNKIIFKGKFENGEKKSGTGTEYYDENHRNKKYVGLYQNDQWHGEGILYDEEGIERYIGNFKEGKRHGKGRWKFPNSWAYTGEWNQDFIEGEGTQRRADNSVFYKGSWEQNKFHGEGTMYHNDGFTRKYRGFWRSGKRHGTGKEYYPNEKLKYDGEYVDGLVHGTGTIYFPDGNYFTGLFEEGKMNGHGVLYHENGRILRNGNWLDDRPVN